MVRTGRLLGGAMAAQLLPSLPTPAAHAQGLSYSPMSEPDYWRFADETFPAFDSLWASSLGVYKFSTAAGGRPDSLNNAALLLTHAVAALAGHSGASRQDERARSLAQRLCQAPHFIGAAGGKPCGQYHVPGWARPVGPDACMHVSFDPQIVEALTYAYQARDALGLPAATVGLIRDRVSRVAESSFFRFPSIRLNQINWYAQMYASNAAVTGDRRLLVDDYREQLVRFAIGITRRTRGHRTTNLAPDYRLHYFPANPSTSAANLDSPEYACIVVTALRHYPAALAAGMRPLAPEHVALFRAWVERIVCGYWTHAGYLNWDTGLGVDRLGYGQYWAWAQQGLIAIALTEAFQARPEIGAWARFFFDRALALYRRLARAGDSAGLTAPPLLFASRFPASRVSFAARMQANAARAVALGLARRPAAAPPPLYAFDPGIGRLAITTPSYSTAILPVNQGAVPYGGLELARFFDSDQRVLSNVAGRPPASFGTVVTGPGGHRELSSQHGLRRAPARPPVVLTGSPRGAVGRGRPYPAHPYAGRFSRIQERGRVESRDLALTSAHAFEADFIEARLVLRRKRGRRRFTVTLLLPTYGRGASIAAVMDGGRRLVLAGPGEARNRIRLDDLAYLHLSSGAAGYVVVLVRQREAISARVIRPAPQASAQAPGPTLALDLARSSRFHRLECLLRMAPASDAAEAATVARRLGRA